MTNYCSPANTHLTSHHQSFIYDHRPLRYHYLFTLTEKLKRMHRDRELYIYFEIKPTLYIKIIIRIKKIKKFRHAVTRINNEETVNARLGFIWVKKTRSISFPWLVQQISNGCWDRLSCNHCRYRIFCYLPEAP